MGRLLQLVVFALLSFGQHAFAGYAYPAPPGGVTGTPAAPLGRAAANDSVWQRYLRMPVGPSVNVGGRAVVLPAAMRFAANAPRFAAAGIHPLVLAGVYLAPVVIDWLNANGYFVVDSKVVKKDPTACSVGPCYDYSVSTADSSGVTSGYQATPLLAASVFATSYNAYPSYGTYLVSLDECDLSYCYFEKRYDSNGSLAEARAIFEITKRSIEPKPVVWLPVSPQEFEDGMAPVPLPDALPKLLPFPLPVDPLPVINPSPDAVPLPQPLRLPQGSPQPVPNTDPQQYRTPVIDLVPSPTPVTPWRVELVPRDIISLDPTPLPESSVPVAPADPASEPVKDADLCAKNPDILACQKVDLGTLDPVAMPNIDRSLSIQAGSGWGPSTSGCPAPKTATVMGVSLVMPFTLICDFASAIRPMLIGFAWLSAALTFFGLGRKD